MIFLILFFPLLNFILLFFFGSLLGFYGSIFLVIFFFVLLLFIIIYIFFIVIKLNGIFILNFSVKLLFFNDLLTWVFLFDALSLIMLLLVCIISFIVHIYSSQYMEYDLHVIRFMSLLSLFTFFMFLLIVSSNLVQLFFGWEGVGLCSYLLINFWFTRIQANKSAMKAMFVNKIGDISLLFLICLVYYYFKTVDFFVLYNIFEFYKNYYYIFNNLKLLDVIGFLIVFAAMGKSAQLFLHIWLPDAMEGPTPVSALIHAATMVTAGIFFILRMSVFFEFSENILMFMLIVGVCTAFFSGLFALVQYDLKKIVAYSTCSQLGFMLISCGLSRYDIALFHLFNHGFFKALLFLSCGSIIHALQDEQDIRKMGGLVFFLPFTYIAFFVGNFALIGFPFLTGFFSKEVILLIFFLKKKLYILFFFFLILVSTVLTVIYSYRLLFYIFFNYINGFFSYYKNIKEVDNCIFLSLFILIIFSIFEGLFFNDLFIGFGSNYFFFNFFYNLKNLYFFYEYEFIFFLFKLIPLILIIIGFIIIYYCFFFFKFQFNYFISNNYYFLLFKFLSYKGYFDLIYNYFLSGNFLKFSFFITFKLIDKNFFEIFGSFGFYFFLYKLNKFFLFFFNSFLYNYLFFFIFSYFYFFFFFNLYILIFIILYFFLIND